MRTFNVRGNWRDLLMMSRAPRIESDDSLVAERPADRRVGSAMIDAADGFPLHLLGALVLGISR